MLDLETASTATNAAIVTIGMVQILRHDAAYVTEISQASFYTELGIPHQLCRGLITDPSTKAFWDTISALPRRIYDTALSDFADPTDQLWRAVEWIENIAKATGEDPVVWGNSPSFDCRILEHALCVYGIEVPWKFRNERDVRTASHLFKVPIEKTRPTTPHHALADATAEAHTLIAINQSLPETMSLFL